MNIFFDENIDAISQFRTLPIPFSDITLLENQNLELLAQIAATEKFESYLEHRLDAKAHTSLKSNIFWTDNPTDFVEMVYAFHTHRSFNGGNISIQTLAESLAIFFNIPPPTNIYRTWNDIKSRTKRIDSYLNSLCLGLTKKAKDDTETID